MLRMKKWRLTWNSNDRSSLPVIVSQTFTTLSWLAVANVLPSGDMAKALTGILCACQVLTAQGGVAGFAASMYVRSPTFKFPLGTVGVDLFLARVTIQTS